MAQVFQLDDHIDPQILRLPDHPSHHRKGGLLKLSGMKNDEKMRALQKPCCNQVDKNDTKDTPKPPRFHITPPIWSSMFMSGLKVIPEATHGHGNDANGLRNGPWKRPHTTHVESPAIIEPSSGQGWGKKWRHQVRWLEKLQYTFQSSLRRSVYKLVSKSSTTFFSKRKSLWRRAWWNWISHMQLHWKEASMVLVQGNHRFSNSRLATPRKSDWVRGWAQRWQTVKKSILPNRKLRGEGGMSSFSTVSKQCPQVGE